MSRYTYPAIPTSRLKRDHGFTSLLTPDGYSPKLNKGRARNYASAVLHLAPSDLSGRNVCRWASDGCRAACLNTAGRGGIMRKGETSNNIQRARIARTRYFFENRNAFMAQLSAEIERHISKAIRQGMTPAVRLNGTSDLPYERITGSDGRTMFELFPEVQFYDYTKSVTRALLHATGQMPANYHVTFSRSEVNAEDVKSVLRAGGNVAVVFAKKLPADWNGATVVNGDQDDLRFLDPRGVVVGLKAKGRARGEATGFVVAPAATSVALPMLSAVAS